MHAYLIIGSGIGLKTKIEEKTKQGKTVEFLFTKISDVRELSKFTKFKLTEKTAIVLKDFDSASEEAQNAFLKALEEPQENLTYILTVNNIDHVLATIVSRCEVIEVQSEKLEIKSEDKDQISKFINAEVGEKLKITSTINKRDEGTHFIKNLILVTHETFLEKPEMANIMENANKTLRNLEANGNVQLQLTNFVINF